MKDASCTRYIGIRNLQKRKILLLKKMLSEMQNRVLKGLLCVRATSDRLDNESDEQRQNCHQWLDPHELNKRLTTVRERTWKAGRNKTKVRKLWITNVIWTLVKMKKPQNEKNIKKCKDYKNYRKCSETHIDSCHFKRSRLTKISLNINPALNTMKPPQNRAL